MTRVFALVYTTITTTVLWPFVQDYPGEPVPEESERNIHPHTYPDHHPTFISFFPSTTIHYVVPVQFTCLTILLHNLFPSRLWSTS